MISGTFHVDLAGAETLKNSLVKKIIKKAITQAAKPVKGAVKSNAQATARYGYLAKSIGVKVRVYDNGAVAVVGPRSKFIKDKGVYTRGKRKGEARRIRPSQYAHLVEKGGSHSKAHPFLKPALDSETSTYLESLANLIKEGIAAELSKSSAA